MSNITSIAGASVWMLVSALLFFAALEPVPMTSAHAAANSAAAQHNGASTSPRA